MVVLCTLGSDVCQRSQLVCHLNLHDHLWLHILRIDSHTVLSSAANPVDSVLMTSPFSYLLLPPTSLILFQSLKPSLLAFTRLAHLQFSASFMACGPVDLILLLHAVNKLFIKSLLEVLLQQNYHFQLYLQMIGVSRGMSLHLFWLKTCWFGMNGLILPSPKTICFETVSTQKALNSWVTWVKAWLSSSATELS